MVIATTAAVIAFRLLAGLCLQAFRAFVDMPSNLLGMSKVRSVSASLELCRRVALQIVVVLDAA